METILCAIRGGEASYRTQDAAIEIAKERGAELLFLYVVDISFTDKTERAIREDTLNTEMGHMGDFLLDMAVSRAEREGVPARGVVRRGKIQDELIALARESNAAAVVLGKPADEQSYFSQEQLERLAQDIESETAAAVYIR